MPDIVKVDLRYYRLPDDPQDGLDTSSLIPPWLETEQEAFPGPLWARPMSQEWIRWTPRVYPDPDGIDTTLLSGGGSGVKLGDHNDELIMPVVWPSQWTPVVFLDDETLPNATVPPSQVDDSDYLTEAGIVNPRPMLQAWISWNPRVFLDDEVISHPFPGLDDLILPPVKSNWYWQYQTIPTWMGAEEFVHVIPLVCAPVILSDGWSFSPGMQNGNVYSTGMQSGQVGRRG